MAVLKMILWGINQIKLSEIMWQRIRTVPKYWTLTFVARIYSWDVSKSSAHSGNAQTFPFLSALLMYDITNLSFFLVSTIPRYHFVSFPSAQNAITCSHCTISLYFWHIAPILLLNISLMFVGTLHYTNHWWWSIWSTLHCWNTKSDFVNIPRLRGCGGFFLTEKLQLLVSWTCKSFVHIWLHCKA